MFIYPFTYSSIYPSIHHPAIHPSSTYSSIHTYSSIYLFISPCIHPSIHSSITHPFIYSYIFIHPFVYLPIHPSIQLFVCHPCIYPLIYPFLHSLFIQLSSTLQTLVLSCPCLSVHPSPSALVLPYSRSPCLSSLESHPFPVSPPPPSFSRQRCCSPIQPTASFWPLTPVPLEAPAPPHPPGPNPPTPRVSPSAPGLFQAPHTSTGAGKSPHILHSLLSLLWPLLLS